MAGLTAGRRREHGVAALEFALTMPLLLAVVGGTFYLGVALFTKFIVANAANSAVRACVIRQQSFWKDADFQACAISTFTSGSQDGSFSGLCSGTSPTVSATTTPFAAALPQTKLLVLKVMCPMTLGGIVNAYGSNTSTTMNMVVNASMPYTLGRPNT